VTTQALPAREGVEVRATANSLADVAAAALDARKRWPRATLIVCAPEPLLRRLEERYPPFIDIGLTSATSEALNEALESTRPL
jgi:hypothetical protein